MCIENKYIFNNSKLLYTNQFNRMLQPIKCGHCFECKEQHTKEIIYRSQWQANECFESNGYVIFDTLTYRDNELPHINEVLGINEKDNFSCFRNKDIVNFKKTLRIYIQRHYGKNHILKFLHTSEYGTSEKGTHRPHYHIIVFYKSTGFEKINPETLSVLINWKWGKGKTDGVIDQGINYFQNKRLFKNNSPYNLNVIRYVAKYTEKQSTYEDTITKRINKLIKRNIINKEQGYIRDKDGDPKEYYTKGVISNELNYWERIEARKIKNAINQSSRISNGFGIKALENISDNDLFVSYKDTKDVIVTLPIPLYYIRKKYQILNYYNIGKEIHSRWIYNSKGIEYKKKIMKLQEDNLASKFTCAYISMEDNRNITKLLGNRTFKDLARYKLYYKNRMFNEYGEIPHIEDIYNNIDKQKGIQLYNYTTPKDVAIYGNQYTTRKPIEQIELKKSNETKEVIKKRCINQNTLEEFRNFDIILNLIYNYTKEIGLKKQKEYEERKERERQAKLLGILQ